ncbi:hypothetical protein COX99_03495 [Candidatus Pacearchaeota archaeon CG_4_10_14_0_2_um_filter_31_10]|nr:MAG: hypothetical protein COX99_03495 [Candidatus Pacearchaeota archaeon CG_4_10_14_0_2_um_filter_31_10]
MIIKNRRDLIRAYIEFFKSKNHKQIVNSSLIPENDPTVLFTTAGMHPLVPYLLGEKHPLGKRLVNVQKCIRTGDINSVGDDFHLTFFEMLGNWSLNDYWKEESIKMSFEFLTEKLNISKEKISVTCFKGEKNIPKDEESAKIWKSLEIKKIEFKGKDDNFWGPAGLTGPCGPDTEMFVNNFEIWNNVFMEYNKDKRLILVDGMHCIYDENFNLNKELLEMINSFNSHNVLAVNKLREKGCSLVKNHSPGQDTNWEAFSLEENEIKKENLEYFKILLKRFNLIPEEVIYFDHDKKNVETAGKLGILSKQYTDVKSTKKFIEDNLFVFIPTKQKNVDTGMGVERTLVILLNKKNVYEIFELKEIKDLVQKLTNIKKPTKEQEKNLRIITDHLRAAVFILNEKITPSNTEHGYVLRRLIRRAIRYGRLMGINCQFTRQIAEKIMNIHNDYQFNKEFILEEIEKEENRFLATLEKGLKVFENIIKDKKLDGKEAFLLYQSYGFPIELTEDLCKEKNIKIDKGGYEKELAKHQELSRTASSETFKSGLADNSEATTRLHTATHLLNEALREVLKKDIEQRGSNITPERLRFDFNFDRRLTDEELKKIEEIVNKKISEELEVIKEEGTVDDAIKKGAQAVFKEKYGEKVSIYSICDKSKKPYSCEICTGPHVKNLKELGRFKIIKEESVSAGVRRIKAILE